MSGNSRHFRRLPTTANDQTARWLKIIAILALALYLGGAGSTTPAQAAPRANETIFNFYIVTPPIRNPACANTHQEVPFFIRVARVADLNGNPVDLKGSLGIPAIVVQAVSSDDRIAEFNPEFRTASALGNLGIRRAGFDLHTRAPGSATLTLTGQAQWAGERLTFPPHAVPIEVVNCDFKVTITSIYSASAPYLMETAVVTVTGELHGNDDGTLSGEADVIWNAQQGTPCLAVIQTIEPTKATLEGTFSDDGRSLTVNVTFDPASLFQQNTITCGVDVTSHQQNQFQPPPLEFTVPITGASRSKSVSLPMGELNLTGTAIFNASPIEAK